MGEIQILERSLIDFEVNFMDLLKYVSMKKVHIPTSKYLSKIAKIEPKYLDRTFCVVAKKDELVPRISSVLPGTHLVELPIIGHVRLHAFSKITYDTIIKIAKGELK